MRPQVSFSKSFLLMCKADFLPRAHFKGQCQKTSVPVKLQSLQAADQNTLHFVLFPLLACGEVLQIESAQGTVPVECCAEL